MKKNKKKFRKDIMTVMDCVLQNQLFIFRMLNDENKMTEADAELCDECFNKTNYVIDKNVSPYIEYKNMWDNE